MAIIRRLGLRSCQPQEFGPSLPSSFSLVALFDVAWVGGKQELLCPTFSKVLGNAEWQLLNNASGFVGSKNITLAEGQIKKVFFKTNPLSERKSSNRSELSRVS